VLRDGRFIIELNPRLTYKDEVVRHMAGREVATQRERKSQAVPRSTEPVLEVRELSRQQEFEGVNLELYRGEILGISGLIGSGRTELGKVHFLD
jgi:ribose transport system ATP-binding protein